MRKALVYRYQLYNLASQEISKPIYSGFFTNANFLQTLFYDSSIVVKDLELNIDNDNVSGLDFIDDILSKSLKSCSNDSFVGYLSSNYLKKVDDIKNSKSPSLSFNDWASFLMSTISKYHNSIIEKAFILEKFVSNNLKLNDLPKTFLSYAFRDKGLSFALFLYFLNHGGFLYVDWMWHGKIKNPVLLKSIINKELQSSCQFLFLRTTASELRVKGSCSIRQWCSWEIGNFYVKNRNKKYLIAFYDKKIDNLILDTFKVMTNLNNGIIEPL